MPRPSNNSFLLFAKGARKEGRPLHKIGGLIQAQLQKIESWDKSSRGNHGGPTKSQLMLARDGQTVYYWSAQVTSAPCVCRSGFGAGAHLKHVPASSAEAFEHVVSGRRGCAGHVGGIRTRIQMSVVKQPTSTFLVNKFQLLILSVLPLQSRKVHEGPAKGLRKPSW